MLWIANSCYFIASPISIEAWLAQRDPFRAVGIGHSRPFPLVYRPITPEFADLYEARVEGQVRPILEKHAITIAGISLSRRGRSNKPLTEIDYPHTLRVNTRDEYPDTWISAAQEIQEVFLHAGMPTEEIEVEIRNPSKMKYMVSHVFAVDAGFLEDIESVKQRIVDEVTALCGLAWSSIAFHLRSPKFDSTAAKLPTVLVSFFEGITLDFTSIESRLSETLGHYKGLRLELLRGSVEGTINRGLRRGILAEPSQKPRNGSSIGVEGNTTEAGSLGGWLQFNPRIGPPTKVEVTCHHVVASGLDKDPTTVEYPAAFDRIASINFFVFHLKSTPDKDFEEALGKMQFLHANPVIGKVFAYSGLRKNASNRRMDWAIFKTPVKTPDTYTKNRPPPKSAFKNTEDFPGGVSLSYKMTEDSMVTNMDRIRPGSWVAKTGRTTGVTSGIVNQMRRFIHWEQHGDFCSEEVEVLGLAEDFADRGDSGSFVMNVSGELVGLLIGKDCGATEWGAGFVTPIQDLQEDVKCCA